MSNFDRRFTALAAVLALVTVMVVSAPAAAADDIFASI